MIFFVKKAGLSENSYIAGFGRNLKTSKTDFSSLKIGFLKTAGQWLLVGSLFSLVLPSILVFDEMNSQLNQSFDSALELMGDFLFFLPIPVLSVIVGILLNKNKIRNRKNIICGIIIGALLLVYGLFPVFFGNIKENLRSIEAQLGFEFPQSQGMNYNTSIDLSGNEQNILTLNFEKSVANEFEESIEEDERWSKDSNEQFANIVPEQLKHFPTDFFILYNKATGNFCELPATDGKHEYIYVAYNSDINVAYVCEYTVNYES